MLKGMRHRHLEEELWSHCWDTWLLVAAMYWRSPRTLALTIKLPMARIDEAWRLGVTNEKYHVSLAVVYPMIAKKGIAKYAFEVGSRQLVKSYASIYAVQTLPNPDEENREVQTHKFTASSTRHDFPIREGAECSLSIWKMMDIMTMSEDKTPPIIAFLLSTNLWVSSMAPLLPTHRLSSKQHFDELLSATPNTNFSLTALRTKVGKVLWCSIWVGNCLLGIFFWTEILQVPHGNSRSPCRSRTF